jgi:hypothetical protein
VRSRRSVLREFISLIGAACSGDVRENASPRLDLQSARMCGQSSSELRQGSAQPYGLSKQPLWSLCRLVRFSRRRRRPVADCGKLVPVLRRYALWVWEWVVVPRFSCGRADADGRIGEHMASALTFGRWMMIASRSPSMPVFVLGYSRSQAILNRTETPEVEHLPDSRDMGEVMRETIAAGHPAPGPASCIMEFSGPPWRHTKCRTVKCGDGCLFGRRVRVRI